MVMLRTFLIFLTALLFISLKSGNAQINVDKFGKGITLLGKDSTYQLKVGFRFQTLFNNQWRENDNTGGSDYSSNLLVRRSRLKFDGFVVNPKIQFKAELALSNRDLSGGIGDEFGNTANLVLDASLSYNFYKNWTILFGQRKLPGNRERLISSANLALVDRSRLNSRYTLDRDVGFQLLHHHKLSKKFVIKETVSISQGEGRNVTQGHFDGYGYTFKAELFPMGTFLKKGDYVGGATVKESTPKLALAISYDINNNAVRERGRTGSFITDESGIYFGKDLNSLFLDMMFKYKGFYLMAEYAHRETEDDNPFVLGPLNQEIGTFYTGKAFNVTAGYNLPSNIELGIRYTSNKPDPGVANDEDEYTVGLSKYIVGHKLKIQTDYTIKKIANSSDFKILRLQTEIHF